MLAGSDTISPALETVLYAILDIFSGPVFFLILAKFDTEALAPMALFANPEKGDEEEQY